MYVSGECGVASDPSVFTFPSEKATKLGDGPCVVDVEVQPAKVLVHLTNAGCWGEFAPPPHCPLTWVWEKAHEHGARSTHGGIGWKADGWMFSLPDLNWTGVADDCAP